MSGFAQITFNGCHPLFEDQNYVFNQISIDATGRNSYTTTPVDGAQTCGGIGTCEFMIVWNDVNSMWEFIADDGNGDFSNPLLVYSNTSPSSPNPPSISLGTWVENTTVTSGDCGGDLSTSNATLNGDVQDVVLGTAEFQLENKITLYPNPVENKLTIKHSGVSVENVSLYNVLGRLVFNAKNSDTIDVSTFHSGVYFVKIKTKNKEVIRKIVID